MHKNPFIFKPIPVDSAFCDREDILEKLVRYAHNGTDVVLSSPRRYGKTSLVRRVLHRLREEFLTIYVSFESLDSEKDAAARIAQGVYAAIAEKESAVEKALRWAKDVFTSHTPTVQIGSDGAVTFSAQPRTGAEGRELLRQVLRELGSMAVQMDDRVLLAFDEFQEITRLSGSEGIEGLLRTEIQFQGFAHFFIGSRRAVLRQMFENSGRSFFRSAVLEQLEPLPVADLTSYYMERFAASGKECPQEVAAQLAEKSCGYGFYAQQYGYFCFGATESVADGQSLREAEQAVLEQARPGFDLLTGSLPTNQLKFLRALAAESTQTPTAGHYCQKYDLVSSNVAYARKVLVLQDHIERTDDGWWRVVDPVFRDWLRTLQG